MGTNNGNHGAKGRSGRKGAGVEFATAKLLHDMFMGEISKEEVQEKLKTGKYSLKDVFIAKGYAGNEKVLIELFKKFFPDKIIEQSYGTERKIIIIRGDTPKQCPHCGGGLFGSVPGADNALAPQNTFGMAPIALQGAGSGEEGQENNV